VFGIQIAITSDSMAKTRKRIGTAALPSDVMSAEPDVRAPQSAGDTTASGSERDRVALRAYELYLARGGADGAALDDWLSAERELSPDRQESE
jgi:hypothetical protein